MIPGMSEAAAGLKAGSSVVQALKRSSSPPQWPDMHESLLALHAVLDEWCAAANGTATMIRGERRRRSRPARSSTPYVGISNVMNVGISNVGFVAGGFGGTVFADQARADIETFMRPKARLALRWRGAERRAAARRGLRTLLNVYFPDLLADFTDAIDDRADFAKRNAGIDSRIRSLSDDELAEFEAEAESTHRALIRVTDRLAEIIVEIFPLDPARQTRE